jgi:hypothetical protein
LVQGGPRTGVPIATGVLGFPALSPPRNAQKPPPPPPPPPPRHFSARGVRKHHKKYIENGNLTLVLFRPLTHPPTTGAADFFFGGPKATKWVSAAGSQQELSILPVIARHVQSTRSKKGESTRCSLRRVSAMGTPLVQLAIAPRSSGYGVREAVPHKHLSPCVLVLVHGRARPLAHRHAPGLVGQGPDGVDLTRAKAVGCLGS